MDGTQIAETEIETTDATGYRPITLSADRLSPRGGAKPQFTWLPIRELVIDESYQRPLHKHSHHHIRKIAESFQWSHFSACLVAPAEGLPDYYALIDGQHRTHAALMAGHSEVPCLVVDLDRAGQARAFSWVNGEATAVSAMQVFKAALAAQETWALRARDAVAAGGGRLLTFQKGPTYLKPGEILCVGFIREMIEDDRSEIVTRVIDALNRCDSREDLFMWSFTVIKGLMNATRRCRPPKGRDLAQFIDLARLPRMHVGAAEMIHEKKYRGTTRLALFTDLIEVRMVSWLETGR